MSILVDSAIIEEVAEALATGFVAGVTTNPVLLAKAGRRAEDLIPELCRLTSGPVFYQVTATDPSEREAEARRFAAISPGQVVLKIPATYTDLQLVARLSPEIPCSVTAIFSAAQALLALEAGARYVIPYVNRATRLMGDGIGLTREMAGVVAASGRPAEVLAASLRTPDEVVAATLAGARHVTLPFALITAMAESEHTRAAIEEFDRAAASG